ncbi:MAG: hypothetical protein ACFFCS_10730, partial [Candidatus Hodarchaeota archaeon]
LEFRDNVYETIFMRPDTQDYIWLGLEFGIFFLLIIFGVYMLGIFKRKREEAINKIQADFNKAYGLFMITNAFTQLVFIFSKTLLVFLSNRNVILQNLRSYFMNNEMEIKIGSLFTFTLDFQIIYTFILFFASSLIIIHPAEKYLQKKQKNVLTYMLLITLVLLATILGLAHFFQDIDQTNAMVVNFLMVIYPVAVVLVIVSFILSIAGLFKYYVTITVKTKGKHRKKAILIVIGFIGWLIAIVLEAILNAFLDLTSYAILIAPILFIISTAMLGFKGIMPVIIDFYQSEHICIVHRGIIEGKVFLCRNCNIFYCIKCKEAISKSENKCWNCNAILDDSLVIKEEIIAESRTVPETGISMPEGKKPRRDLIKGVKQDDDYKGIKITDQKDTLEN